MVEKVARAICAEKCAFMGEPPCHTVMDGTEFSWPPETCCEPGCIAEARAALAVARPAIKEECAKVVEVTIYLLSIVDPREPPFIRDKRICEETREQAAAAIRAME
jgi:hypothetical protein